MIYSSSIRNLFIGRGILNNISAPHAISIYQGTQPTAAAITAAWANYNSPAGGLLVHYVGATWTQPNANAANGIYMQLSTLPAAATPLDTGTATWAIMWASNVSQATVLGATLPNISFIVVPVSNTVTNGVIRFTSTAISTGVAVAIVDGSIAALT